MAGEIYMKRTKLSAALIAAITAVTPLSFSDPIVCAPSAVSAEDAGTVTASPDWIPTDFDSAVSFRNTYGATHIDNGLICVVSALKSDPVPKGEPQGMQRYEVHATDKSVKMLRHTSFGSEISSYYYDVAVFEPQQAGVFDIALIDTWAKDTDPDLQYGHAVARYSFSAAEDTGITETDIFSWLPDGKTEFSDYLRDYGEVSVKDNYVVFCTMRIDQFGDQWEADSSNKYEKIQYLRSSDCTMQACDMYDDGSVDVIYVYQAVKDGYEKISWVRTSGQRPDPEEPKRTTLTADCVILDDAQTVLLDGQTRVTVKDSETGELIPDDILAAEPFRFHADIVYQPDLYSSLNGGAANYTVTKNRSVLKEVSLSPGLSSLAQAYKKADHFEITAKEQPEIRYYDNGAMDLTFGPAMQVRGDVNGDGAFDALDAGLLQKWLSAVPDTQLANREAADFRNDSKLNAVDLSLMKQALLTKPASVCVEPDESYTFANSFTVKEDGLKLYLGPNESYESVASIPAGTQLYELGTQKDNPYWLFTKYDGKSGWIRVVREDNQTMTVVFQTGFGKPVIYLYPEQETDVHVELELTGSELSTTYPKYNGGWDVTAYPDGTLVNKADGTHHRYLFWDSVNSRTRFDYSKGFCVPGSDTEHFLKEKLTYMGLNEAEMNEFIVYWLPKLEHHAYNLIAFQSDAYTNAAKLTVTPAPDSECRIFMAYVPLESPVEIEPQQLESFERKGFAVVEWGGAEILS